MALRRRRRWTGTIGAMTTFHVDSEVGALRSVLLHRPDLELRRLTPTQLPRAAVRRRPLGQAGPPGARRLRRHAPRPRHRGPRVGDLLAETMKDAVARRGSSTASSRRSASAVNLPEPTRELPRVPTRPPWPTHLIGGLTVGEMPPAPGPGSGRRGRAGRRRSYCHRSRTTCSPGTPRAGSTAGSPSTRWPCPPADVRPPTSRPSTASTRCFAAEPFTRWFGGVDEDHGTATIEGGDVLVIGDGAVLDRHGRADHPPGGRGASPGTSSPAAAPTTVIAVALPSTRVRSCTWTRS